MERTYNGFGTVLQRTYSDSQTRAKRSIEIVKYELEKTFSYKPYTPTPAPLIFL